MILSMIASEMGLSLSGSGLILSYHPSGSYCVQKIIDLLQRASAISGIMYDSAGVSLRISHSSRISRSTFLYASITFLNSPLSLATVSSSSSSGIRIYFTVLNLRQAELPRAQAIYVFPFPDAPLRMI